MMLTEPGGGLRPPRVRDVVLGLTGLAIVFLLALLCGARAWGGP